MKYLKKFEGFQEEINDYTNLATKAIPNYRKIVPTDEDEKRADEIYQKSIDDMNYFKEDTKGLNNASDDKFNNSIMKIIDKIKKKYPNENWDILQKPMYNKIHSGIK